MQLFQSPDAAKFIAYLCLFKGFRRFKKCEMIQDYEMMKTAF